MDYCVCCHKGYFTDIKVGQIQLGDWRDFTTQDGVVFDTGAQFSYISSNNNNIGFSFFYFLPRLTIQMVIKKNYQCISHQILK